jgi:hypothetical protein
MIVYTGATIAEAIDTYMDEVGSGYIDPDSKNIILAKALIQAVDKKVEEFQGTLKVTREMQPLIVVSNPIAPSLGHIDVSQTSTSVPDYYSIISLFVTSPYLSRTLSKYAEERKFGEFVSNFTAGSPIYPRYYFTNGRLNIEPTTATSVVITYFKTPPIIDVNDAVTPVPFNEKLIQFIIDQFMEIAGVKGRDQWITQTAAGGEIKNP